MPGPFWYFRNALASDDPDHSRYRPVIVDALSGITADGTRLAVRRIATELLAPVALTGKADLVADFAFRVPLLVLNRYFGLSAEEGLELVELMRQVWDGGEEAEKHGWSLFAYAQSVTARRRENPEATSSPGWSATPTHWTTKRSRTSSSCLFQRHTT